MNYSELTPGKKAYLTKIARRFFMDTYGRSAYSAVIFLLQGYDTQEIAETLRLPRQAVAAYKAHLTRCTYEHQWDFNGTSHDNLLEACRF